jgi:predicted nucleic acid-binding protein
VRVYAESNFVLEVVLEQEQHEACEELFALAASRSIELVLPAFALLEPHEAIVRDERGGKRLIEELRTSATQLQRTASIAADVPRLGDAADVLSRAAQEAWDRFRDVRTRLLDVASLLAIDGSTLRDAQKLSTDFELALPDAVMLASVLADAARRPASSAFLNRNTKDFDAGVKARLKQVDCVLIGSFDGGLARVRHTLAKARGA